MMVSLSSFRFPLNPFIKRVSVSLLVILFVGGLLQPVLAQENGNKAKAPVKPKAVADTNGKTKPGATTPLTETTIENPAPELSPIEKLQIQLLQVTNKRINIRSELSKLSHEKPTKEVTKKIEELQSELDSLNTNFETLATQLQVEEIPNSEEKTISWTEELQEITKPFLKAVREVTSRPRRIENLKAKIDSIRTKIANYEQAQANLDELFKVEQGIPDSLNSENKKGAWKQELNKNYQKDLILLKKKYDPEILKLKLDETERNLDKILNSDQSVLSVLTDTLGDFFKVRGKNLLISITTFFGLIWILSRIYNALNERPQVQRWIRRPVRKIFKALFNVFAFTIAAMASLLSLYLLDDWLLLSMIILVLLILGWTSRQLIPKILEELRIILNLGTVREGERLVWRGVPWLVKELGLYATLMNPRLEGGVFKLPVGELVGEHSRPFVKEEEWFPTNISDWVYLADDTYGNILSQTPEHVIIEHLGSRKYYLTTDFLSLKPRNLSSGFSLIINFGLDYGVQSRITKEIPELFQTRLNEHFASKLESVPPKIEKIKVEFNSAGSSSLDLKIIVMVDGKLAELYYPLQRKVNAVLVDVCNENGFTIPFPQLTMSLSPSLQQSTFVKNTDQQTTSSED